MEDIIFRTAQRNDYQELAGWIVGLSATPEQHCLHSWSGEEAGVLRDQLLKYLDESELFYILAFQAHKLVGAMGCEYDEELCRAWLHGPHAVNERWETLAPGLYERLLMNLPAPIVQLDAYLNIKNIRGRRFYSQQGFEERESLSYEYWLTPAGRIVPGEKPCDLLEGQYEASFVRLYQAIFPSAYYSGERVLRMLGDSHQVFVVVEGKDVIGFVVASVDESSSIGEIQFLGVREDRRGQGYGRRLLLSAVDWLLENAQVSRVCLSVGEERVNARGLYESAGFKLRFTGIGLQKTLLKH